MSITAFNRDFTEVPIKVNETAASETAGRRFQAHLQVNDTLQGDELVAALAKYGFNDQPIKAKLAIEAIESFILDRLKAGVRLDFGLASFYPRLSKGLTARDADPMADGCWVKGGVKARRKLNGALKDCVRAVNSMTSKYQRVNSVFDKVMKRFDVIAAEHLLSVSGYDIDIVEGREDECVWLEKRDAHRRHVPIKVVKAEVLSSSPMMTEIIFHELPPKGKYILAFYTRGGASLSYKVRRVGHPVKVI